MLKLRLDPCGFVYQYPVSPAIFSAPHSKAPFNLVLSGITNDNVDLSVDALKAVTLPLLKRFGAAEDGGLEIKVPCCVQLLGGSGVFYVTPNVVRSDLCSKILYRITNRFECCLNTIHCDDLLWSLVSYQLFEI